MMRTRCGGWLLRLVLATDDHRNQVLGIQSALECRDNLLVTDGPDAIRPGIQVVERQAVVADHRQVVDHAGVVRDPQWEPQSHAVAAVVKLLFARSIGHKTPDLRIGSIQSLVHLVAPGLEPQSEGSAVSQGKEIAVDGIGETLVAADFLHQP